MVNAISNILKGVLGGAKEKNNVTGHAGQRVAGTVGFPKTLTVANFFTADQTSLSTSQFNTLGTYTVSTQTAVSIGFGDPNVGSGGNQGKLFIDLENTSSTDNDGLVRIVISNAQGTKKFVVLEERTERLSIGATAPSERFPLPEQMQFPLVGEDSIIEVQFKPDSDTVVGNDESQLELPITLYQ